jgi:hypothetical protein
VSKRARQVPSLDPYLAWGDLGLQALEMLAASARVIHHRTSRRNSPEQLFTMGNEKVQAAVESSNAMTRHWLAMQDNGGLALLSQWPSILSTGMKPFRARALSNARRISRR